MTITRVDPDTTEKLDPEFKVEWCAALRSGHYVQGMFNLKARSEKGISWCCIGVAADLWDSSQWDNRRSGAEPFGPFNSEVWEDAPNTSYIPPSLIPGLTQDVQIHLGHMNDDEQKNFNQIADWVEENL